MMRFYGGSVSYEQLMDMPFKAFLMLYDYMMWQMREQDEKGQKLNKRIERTDLMQVFGPEGIKYNESKNIDDAFKKIRRNIPT